jgi:uncharacterized protein (TIGR00369 family)
MDHTGPLLQDLRERIAASPFHTSLGLQVIEASEGRVHLAIDTTEEQRNLLGTIHGGVLATLADTAMGLAVRTSVEPGRSHVTIEMTVHYLRPAAPGSIHAAATVLRSGSQIAYAEADVTTPDGTLLARASATYSTAAR